MDPPERYTDDEDYSSNDEHIDEEDEQLDDRHSLIEMSSAGRGRIPLDLDHMEYRASTSSSRSCCTGRRKALALTSILLIVYFAMKYEVDEVKWVVTEIESDLFGSRCNNASFVQGEPNAEPFIPEAVSLDHNFSEFEPLGGGRFSEYKDGDSPFDLTQSMKSQSDKVALSRRVHVVNAMKHVWKNYKERAFGNDELLPISGKGTDIWGGMGTT